MNPLFLIFLALAALLVLNAVNAFKKAARNENRSSNIATGAVSIVVAVAIACAGHFMFNF